MHLDLTSLKKALAALELTSSAAQDSEGQTALSEGQRLAIRAGVVQHFEFTYELCWKFMKRWLVAVAGRNDVDGVSRRELFRIASQELLIEDVNSWFDFHTARNRVAHTYNEAAADEVFAMAVRFSTYAAALLTQLEARND